MRNFIGRDRDLKKLQLLWKERRSQIIAVYGRRRVGKTRLIEKFCEDKKHFRFEALEGEETSIQIKHFLSQLAEQTGESYLADLDYDDWNPVFKILDQKIKEYPSLIVSFDELPWMATRHSKLISLIKFYWDQYWKKHPHLILILCGSIAAWMLKNVVRSKALYGRISQNFLIEALKPQEVFEFIQKKRGQKETLEYYLCFGGIPRYLEEFNFNQSLALNIENKCFANGSFFSEEATKIFYSHFKETKNYEKIAEILSKGSRSSENISKALKMSSSGGFKVYLDNLLAAGIIQKLAVIKNFKASRRYRYYLSDEFLKFDSIYIKPNQNKIAQNRSQNFINFTHSSWHNFLGLAFERFCIKQRYLIAEHLGFVNQVETAAPIQASKQENYQYDLVYLRNDDCISLCEMKYSQKPLKTSIIKEFEDKLAKSKIPKGLSVEKILICNQEPTKSLIESGYFHQVLNIQDLFIG